MAKDSPYSIFIMFAMGLLFAIVGSQASKLPEPAPGVERDPAYMRFADTIIRGFEENPIYIAAAGILAGLFLFVQFRK